MSYVGIIRQALNQRLYCGLRTVAKYSGKEWKGRVERNRGCNVEPSWDFRAEINSNQNQKCLDGLSHRMGIREESVDLKIDQQIIQSQQQTIKTKQSKTKQSLRVWDNTPNV